MANRKVPERSTLMALVRDDRGRLDEASNVSEHRKLKLPSEPSEAPSLEPRASSLKPIAWWA